MQSSSSKRIAALLILCALPGITFVASANLERCFMNIIKWNLSRMPTCDAISRAVKCTVEEFSNLIRGLPDADLQSLEKIVKDGLDFLGTNCNINVPALVKETLRKNVADYDSAVTPEDCVSVFKKVAFSNDDLECYDVRQYVKCHLRVIDNVDIIPYVKKHSMYERPIVEALQEMETHCTVDIEAMVDKL